MIKPTKPIEVSETRLYDGYWLKSLTINAPSPTDMAFVVANLVPYNSQTGEMFYELEKSLYIDDILKLAETDMSLANTCNTIFNEIERQSQMKGII